MRFLLAAVALAYAAPAFGHGGGLNPCGCHFNRKTGDCHCHQPNGSCSCACSICGNSDARAGDSIVVQCGQSTTRGYTKKSGTYVAPHRRTSPNRTKTDNWSSKGNANPYTGKKGSKKL